ncbi:ComEC/Rec2 family competence protein [Aureibacillus halotolerans]|uniref:Beta-lactamase superfamily II metal-dependent hydrolase n=1 Tax=Aureibacillus halotolerans TaxID=1508390 RepID=A0A4R6UCL8_9BACI|nr:ComEC/Rec2 family competence protein [Aureibacillus halotolerans]TDQ42863.1 beta-lactamase superfamily II metal-dependent hydrolase [Aureibacillus halotolerans]
MRRIALVLVLGGVLAAYVTGAFDIVEKELSAFIDVDTSDNQVELPAIFAWLGFGGSSKSFPAGTSNENGKPRVVFFDVGQGDASLIQTANANVLIDTGNQASIVQDLKDHDVEKLDALVLTHPHDDHIRYADKIIEEFDPKHIITNGVYNGTKNEDRFLDAMEEKQKVLDVPKPGEIFSIDDIALHFYGPVQVTGDTNNDSLVFKAEVDGVDVLFTGDAEIDGEAAVAPSLEPVDVYHVGHHGSKTSSSPALLDAINPKIAIYSAKKDNKYGHPHKEVIDRLKAKSVKVYGTDKHGTIYLNIRNGKPTIMTTKGNVKQIDLPAWLGVCSEELTEEEIAEMEEAVADVGNERIKEVMERRPIESIEELQNIDANGVNKITEIIKKLNSCLEREENNE